MRATWCLPKRECLKSYSPGQITSPHPPWCPIISLQWHALNCSPTKAFHICRVKREKLGCLIKQCCRHYYFRHTINVWNSLPWCMVITISLECLTNIFQNTFITFSPIPLKLIPPSINPLSRYQFPSKMKASPIFLTSVSLVCWCSLRSLFTGRQMSS